MSVKVIRELENESEKPVPTEDFPALEEKIYKAIELLKSAREAKAAAEPQRARGSPRPGGKNAEADRPTGS
jgi:hypothetical protein